MKNKLGQCCQLDACIKKPKNYLKFISYCISHNKIKIVREK